MERFKKISVQNLRKMIKDQGFKGTKSLKGYSYMKKKDLIEKLIQLNIPDKILDKYRTNKKVKVIKEKGIKISPSKVEYHVVLIDDKDYKVDRIYHSKNMAIKYFEDKMKTYNKNKSKAYLIRKKSGKSIIIRIGDDLDDKMDENYDKMRNLVQKVTIPSKHIKHHTKEHIEIMKREMKKGKSFSDAHDFAIKKEKKKKKEKKDKMSY